MDNTTAGRLRTALQYISRVHPTPDVLRGLLDLSNELYDQCEQIQSTSQHPGQHHKADTILRLLTICSEIWTNKQTALNDILPLIPNEVLNPESRERLSFQLHALGQYQRFAKRLLKYARRYPIFMKIQVRAVHLQPHDLSKYLLSRAEHPKTWLWDSYQLHLKKQRTRHPNAVKPGIKESDLLETGETLQKRVRNILAENRCKVHAEIQLLLDYECRPQTIYPPRVLKASKDACFLCDLFVKHYGTFFVPDTHGRVYDRWALPDLQKLNIPRKRKAELKEIVRKFTDAVEMRAFIAAARPQRRGKPPKEEHVPSIVSTATQETFKKVEVSVVDCGPPKKITRSDQSRADSLASDVPQSPQLPSNSTPSAASLQIPQQVSVQEAGLMKAKNHPITPASSSPTRESSRVGTSPPSLSRVLHLAPGVPRQHIFTSEEPAINFYTPRIHMEVSHEQLLHMIPQNGDITNAMSLGRLKLEVMQLRPDVARDVENNSSDLIVSLEHEWDVPTARDGALFSEQGLLLKNRSDIVRLRLLA